MFLIYWSHIWFSLFSFIHESMMKPPTGEVQTPENGREPIFSSSLLLAGWVSAFFAANFALYSLCPYSLYTHCYLKPAAAEPIVLLQLTQTKVSSIQGYTKVLHATGTSIKIEGKYVLSVVEPRLPESELVVIIITLQNWHQMMRWTWCGLLIAPGGGIPLTGGDLELGRALLSITWFLSYYVEYHF